MSGDPQYDLERVRAAARKGSVFLSASAQRDYQNLDYDLQTVHDCIAGLTPENFRGTKDYKGIKLDVYFVINTHNHHVDELYIKLKEGVSTTVPQVTVMSFHRDR